MPLVLNISSRKRKGLLFRSIHKTKIKLNCFMQKIHIVYAEIEFFIKHLHKKVESDRISKLRFKKTYGIVVMC